MCTKPPTIDTLTRIWQGVLRRCPIAAEENFFDLGGNDSLADLLFKEIALSFGRQLPSVTINCAPTIAALAALLEQPALPAFFPLVQMRPGSEKPPIFMVHGMGGRAVELFNVVRYIQTNHPIYGIQAKGIDGLQEPLDGVEDMASFYLSALEEIEPHGPYILIGYSFGGLVAPEMAQQLSANQKHVGLLVLLDTYPHARSLGRVQRLRLIAQRVKFHIDEIWRLRLSGALQYFVRKLKARRRLLSPALNKTTNDGAISGLSFAEASLRVEQKSYSAMANYRPQFYHGKINFVVAAETKSFFLPPDPVSIWKNFTEDFEFDSIPGDHSEMVNARCGDLAAILARYIQEATPDALMLPTKAVSLPAHFPFMEATSRGAPQVAAKSRTGSEKPVPSSG